MSKKVGGAVILGERRPEETAEAEARQAAEAAEKQLQAVLNAVAGMTLEQKAEWLTAQVFELARLMNGVQSILPPIGAAIDDLLRWRGQIEEWQGRVQGQLLLGSPQRRH